MSRKTYTLNATAIAVVAGLSFSIAEGAGAFAQEGADQTAALATGAEAPQGTAETVELVPAQPQFIAQEIVQTLPVQPAPEAAPAAPSTAGSLRALVGTVDTDSAWSEQLQCLAGAVYFEARGEPLDGQLAVAHVVINRAGDGRFPASYCGVVYQRSQFSFVKGGRMPRIPKQTAAWRQAKAVARIAHEGLWDSPVGDAVYFHAAHVRPAWSQRKIRTAQIDTHVFYR